MTRQEKRGMADMRHRDRDQRLRKILAAKSPLPQTLDPAATSALVIGIGPGVCTIHENGLTRNIRCDIPVAPRDEVAVRHEKVRSIAPRRTTLPALTHPIQIANVSSPPTSTSS